jgi:hypothetical protein
MVPSGLATKKWIDPTSTFASVRSSTRPHTLGGLVEKLDTASSPTTTSFRSKLGSALMAQLNLRPRRRLETRRFANVGDVEDVGGVDGSRVEKRPSVRTMIDERVVRYGRRGELDERQSFRCQWIADVIDGHVEVLLGIAQPVGGVEEEARSIKRRRMDILAFGVVLDGREQDRMRLVSRVDEHDARL